MKQGFLTFIFTIVVLFCFAQKSLWTMSADEIRKNGIRSAQESWVFFNDDGEPRDTLELVAFHFDEDGKKRYIIEHTLDIVETRDSIVYIYDDQGREILRRNHIQINPRNRDTDPEEYSWMDTLQEWKTVYEQGKILEISPRHDTIYIHTNASGKVVLERKGYSSTRYSYSERGQLVMKQEIPLVKVGGTLGGFGGDFEPLDTIVTLYNELGNPISTRGSNRNVDYEYENNLLISKVKSSTEYGDLRVVKSVYTYNENDQKIEEKTWVNERAYDWEKYEYNENGFLIKETSLDQETGNIELVIEYTYF